MDALLLLKNITKTFYGLTAVDNFSLSIRPNSITGLIGPNGAGKTTVFNIVTGFLNKEKGEVYFKNLDISKKSPFEINRIGIARTFQDLRLITRLTVLDNMLLSCPNQREMYFPRYILKREKMLKDEGRNRKRVEEILDFVGLVDMHNDLVGELSYGQQKLLSLACSIATETELLLLDEPVSGIHPVMTEKILELMKKLIDMGKTILFIEHNIKAVKKISDIVIVMDHGQNIVVGPPSDILTNEKILEVYLE